MKLFTTNETYNKDLQGLCGALQRAQSSVYTYVQECMYLATAIFSGLMYVLPRVGYLLTNRQAYIIDIIHTKQV
jgi:hypothetical protein